MKSSKSSQNTIDEKHTEMLNMFNEIETVSIPQLQTEIDELLSTIRTLRQDNIDEYMDMRDKIKSKRSEIKKLRAKRKNYLLENSKFIFQYFEQKKDISSGANVQNVSVLNSFFKIHSKNEDVANLQSDNYQNSKKIYQTYWKNVTNEITNFSDFVQPSDICWVCGNGELISQEEDGILICNNTECGRFIVHIVDGSKPANKDLPNEVSYTAYIRLNHFKEILSQLQAKETTHIPKQIIDLIEARISKERIRDYKAELNYNKMREILRKLGLNKYFEHVQYILSLFGIKPPVMSEELHETLCVLFIEIQKPWAVHCPPSRTNFFNYTYTLYQLCVLLDQTQYLPFIPMLKDREKQLEQDMIWKKVCADLDWEFFPTV